MSCNNFRANRFLIHATVEKYIIVLYTRTSYGVYFIVSTLPPGSRSLTFSLFSLLVHVREVNGDGVGLKITRLNN